MSTFEYQNYSGDYLAHHGVKGMKWGIRHDRVRTTGKMRRAKKYGVSEKDIDEIHDSIRKKNRLSRVVSTAFGGVYGAEIGAMISAFGIAPPVLSVPLSAAAGSAVGYLGEQLLEREMENQALVTLHDKRNDGAVRELMDYNVRLRRE